MSQENNVREDEEQYEDASDIAEDAEITFNPRHNKTSAQTTHVPLPFSGKEDANPWLARFELLTQINGWNRSQQRQQFLAAMTEDAAVWAQGLPRQVQVDIDLLKEELHTSFINEDPLWVTRQEVMSYRQRRAPVQFYANELKRKAAKLTMPDSELLHYFINGLREDLKIYVLEKQPRTLREAERQARLIEAIKNKFSESDSEEEDVKESKKRKNTEKTLAEKVKQLEEQLAVMSTSKPKTMTGQGNCHYCGRPGHHQYACYKRRNDEQQNQGRSGSCYKCGRNGHIARNCPQNNVQLN